MKILITENKVQKTIQMTLNKILESLKNIAEEDPKAFDKNVSENIDNFESINIVYFEYDKEEKELTFNCHLEVNLSFDIPFNKWSTIADILSEINWELKQESLPFKTILFLSSVNIINKKNEDW
jgi:predicted transcriptional regulator